MKSLKILFRAVLLLMAAYVFGEYLSNKLLDESKAEREKLVQYVGILAREVNLLLVENHCVLKAIESNPLFNARYAMEDKFGFHYDAERDMFVTKDGWSGAGPSVSDAIRHWGKELTCDSDSAFFMHPMFATVTNKGDVVWRQDVPGAR